MRPDICVLYVGDDITLLHSLYPILTSRRHRSRFFFTQDLEYVLNRATQPVLLLFRYFKRREIFQDQDNWKKLRDRFKKIIYFDDTASADEVNPVAFDYVDLYFKKQLRTDLNSYSMPLYGKRVYADYYHKTLGAVDAVETIRPALKESQWKKLRLSWNLGIGVFPKSRLRNAILRRIPDMLSVKVVPYLYNDPRKYRPAKKTIHAISARLGMIFDRDSVAAHRKLYQEQYAESDLFLTGRVPLKQYNQELRHVFAVFSPFGWGEVCFRDFEAILNHALLIKPSMDHITTWPDVYKSNETYVPVAWDGSDLLTQAKTVLDNPEDFEKVRKYAAEIYMDAFSNLDSRITKFLNEIDGLQ